MTRDDPLHYLEQKVKKLNSELQQYEGEARRMKDEYEAKLGQIKCTEADIANYNELIDNERARRSKR